MLQKGPETKKKFGIEPTAELINHCLSTWECTTENDRCLPSTHYNERTKAAID